ncbi:hypothetical protein M408DRAFT_8415 [Serendipita vermifera MAFF 305830]|uniref:HTH APSES-type domain-containing protein n=1 Tax=Serendipita vermifera MAFF 305830 TaxID=933852 RepID=A0A0C2XIV0_SERVB|nr:hypothetical protein M408DRAFT_8415 [Serendipita vermifera MAFF 305830]
MSRADGQLPLTRRSRQPSTSSSTLLFKNINHHDNNLVVATATTPAVPIAAAAAAPASNPSSLAALLSPGPHVPAPSLRQLVGRSISLHPEDEPDHILAITFAILDRVGNRAMSVKELGEAAYLQGYLRTRWVFIILFTGFFKTPFRASFANVGLSTFSPSAAGQAIGTHIRNHTARHAQEPTNALLSSYRLVGGLEDAKLASALYCTTPGTCRKGTTVWYLSKAAGRPSPFERAMAAAQMASAENPLSGGSGLGIKRKIPPDDDEFHRPNKIRLTLRLPPRTPIPPRPRPIVPVVRYDEQGASGSGTSNSDATSSEEEEDSSEDDESGSDDDMLDDFNSLLADDIPIAIPASHHPYRHHRHHHSRHRSAPSLAAAAAFLLCHTQSQPFYDTCEPPPDSEDEDDDFHNSMLRPDTTMEEEHLRLKSEDVTEFGGADYDIKEEDIAAIVLHELSEPKVEFSPMDDIFTGLAAATTGSPASLVDLDDSVSSSARGSSTAATTAFIPGSSSSAPPPTPTPIPPTPWIKAEDESFMFESRSRQQRYDSEDLLTDILSPIEDTARPWEEQLQQLQNEDEAGWTSVNVPRPESVSTDEVDDVFPAAGDESSAYAGRIQVSTSVPSKPMPLRLSIGGSRASVGPSAHQQQAQSQHARRHSHAAGISNRRLSLISNAATAFSDWTSGTPEDPDAPAPLVTPSHTGWRMYQWPIVAGPPPSMNGRNGSSSTLALHEPIDERECAESEREQAAASASADASAIVDEAMPDVQGDMDEQGPSRKEAEEELDRVFKAGSLNQVLTKSLPPNQRISTLLLLGELIIYWYFVKRAKWSPGIPVFQCHLESPPMVLIRRMDTDFVNISSIITYAKYLALATPAGASRSRSSTNPASTAKPTIPPPPTADELPRNHVFVNSGARELHGGWVSLSRARALVKNYHDLPPFIRRVFLSDGLADKFPGPIAHVRKLLVGCQDKADAPFGKPFGKVDTLSAHDLLAGAAGATTVASPSPGTTAVIADGKVSHRGIQLTLDMAASAAVAAAAVITPANASAIPPASYPLSPVAALSSAHAQRAKAASSMQSLLALTTSPQNPLSTFTGWNLGVSLGGKTVLEREEAPLQPEEEEMLNAILKTPPKASTRPTPTSATASATLASAHQTASDTEDEEMSVDEREEEEAVREAVDIGSDEEEEEDTVQVARSTRQQTQQQQTKQVIAPRRSLRRMRSISSISSELTVSESESSAPPPSLDSRPPVKGKKQVNNPPAPTPAANVSGRKRRSESNATTSVPLPARRAEPEPTTNKRVKIIEVDEPADIVKPRRSIRTAKGGEPVEPTPAPAPTPPARSTKTAAAAATSAPEVKATPPVATSKPRRSTGTVVEKPVEKEGPVLTRAGAAAAAAAAQKNVKRTLRSRV